MTLGFLDPELDRGYQAAVAESNGTQLRIGTLAGVAVWLVAAVLIPVTLTVGTAIVEVICIGMAMLWLGGYAGRRRLTANRSSGSR